MVQRAKIEKNEFRTVSGFIDSQGCPLAFPTNANEITENQTKEEQYMT